MLQRSKFRRKATRIAVSEIMIPIILITVLGFTSLVFVVKLLILPESEEIFGKEERIEIKWIINLGVVIVYSLADLILAYLVYTGIKEKSYRKCHLWVSLQITVLCCFTVVVMKRCNTNAVAAASYHFFEFILLAVCIYIYKIHHITFVYGLLETLKIQNAEDRVIKRARKKMFMKLPIQITTEYDEHAVEAQQRQQSEEAMEARGVAVAVQVQKEEIIACETSL